MNPILQIKDLSSPLQREGVPLLNSVSFTLQSGDRLVLTGPSGSGKSLLLRTLTYLDPTASGDIFFMGSPVTAERVPYFRSQVIYLGQKPCLSEGTVEDNLKKVFEFKVHRNKKYERDRVLELLRSFHFGPSFLSQPAKLLSGGESQVVALIRAIILDPVILLLDEPTASLDSAKNDVFENLVVSWIKAASNRSFIWITHQKEQEQRVGNRWISLMKGLLN